MRNPLPLILIIAGLGGFICSSSVRAATVRKIDDSTVNGELMSIGEGRLMIGVKSDVATTKPTTTAAIGPATRAATQASTQPATKPTSIALSDIVQVVLHDPPAKAPPKAPVATVTVPTANNDSDDESDGVISSVFHALFTSSKSAAPADAADVQVQATQAVAVQPATMPAKRIAATSPTSQPAAAAIHWQVSLIGGDALHGRIDGWSGQKMIFRLDADAARPVALPADQLAAAWCGDAAAQSKAQAMMGEPGPEDIAFVKKDAEVVMVKGLALGIEGDSLHFTHDEQERKISLGKLVGIVFGTTGRHSPAAHFHQLVMLDSGDQISGTWTGITADSIALQTAWGSLLQLPIKSIYTIDFVDGRLAYLSDLKPDKVEQTPYFGRVIPWRANQSLAGGPLVLSDGQYAKGHCGALALRAGV